MARANDGLTEEDYRRTIRGIMEDYAREFPEWGKGAQTELVCDDAGGITRYGISAGTGGNASLTACFISISRAAKSGCNTTASRRNCSTRAYRTIV